MGIWTDEEISTLVSMWPTNSIMKIATRLNRRRETIYAKAKWLHKKGLLEDKDFPGKPGQSTPARKTSMK